MSEVGQDPHVIAWQKPDVQVLAHHQPNSGCADAEKALPLIKSSGTRREQLRIMQRDGESKASILPNHPSLVLLLMETCGGCFTYRRNPQERACPSQKLCSSSPPLVMQSAARTGVPRAHPFDQKRVWRELNPAALRGICTAEMSVQTVCLPPPFWGRSWASSSCSWCNTEPCQRHSRLGLA